MRFDPVECGKRIQSSRKVKNLTRVQLAEQLNISFDHMRLTERGKRACSIDLLVDLSLILEVSLDYLILGKESKADPMKDELNKAIEMLKKSRVNSEGVLRVPPKGVLRVTPAREKSKVS